MTCNHPSGSFFPVGTTVVTCASTDRHGNTSPPAHFAVVVGDSTPPVLQLPGDDPGRGGEPPRHARLVRRDGDRRHRSAPRRVVRAGLGRPVPAGRHDRPLLGDGRLGQPRDGLVPRARARVVRRLPAAHQQQRHVGLPAARARPRALRARDREREHLRSAGDSSSRASTPRDTSASSSRPPACRRSSATPSCSSVPLLPREYDLLMDIHAMAAGPWQLRADLGDGVRTRCASPCGDSAAVDARTRPRSVSAASPRRRARPTRELRRAFSLATRAGYAALCGGAPPVSPPPPTGLRSVASPASAASAV